MTPYERLCADLLTERFGKPTPPPPKRSATPSQIHDLLAELYQDEERDEGAA